MPLYEIKPFVWMQDMACFCEMIEDHETSDAELEDFLAAHPDLLASYEPRDGFLTPLHAACCHKRSYKFIEILVRQVPGLIGISEDSERQLPLHYLCRAHEDYCVEEMLLLLELMVDTCLMPSKAQDVRGETPLHLACRHSAPFPVIEFLIKCYPQSLQIKDHQHCAPLHRACMYVKDLSTIQLLYTSFPLAAQWRIKLKDEVNLLQIASSSDAPLEIIKYLAYDCWPVDCLWDYEYTVCDLSPEAKACVDEVAAEAMSALIDAAYHVKHILPETLKREIAEKAVHYSTTDGANASTADLSTNQCSGLVFDESARATFDHLAEYVMKSKELENVMEKGSGWDDVHVLLDNVIRMNRAGRLYFKKNPNNRVAGIKVLQAASNLDSLFFHLRENPTLNMQM